MQLDLTEEERLALLNLLIETIENDRYNSATGYSWASMPGFRNS